MKTIYGLVTSSLGGTPTLPGKSLEEALRLCEWLCDEVGMRSIEISLAGNMYKRIGPQLFP